MNMATEPTLFDVMATFEIKNTGTNGTGLAWTEWNQLGVREFSSDSVQAEYTYLEPTCTLRAVPKFVVFS